jgi:D-alanyl-D-alanine carboxypeptidase
MVRVVQSATRALAAGLLVTLALAGCAGASGVTPQVAPTSAGASTPPPTPPPTPTPTPDRTGINTPAALSVVVNKHRPLVPADYVPADLVPIEGVTNTNGQPLRAEAATALTAMAADAARVGVQLVVASGYRSYDSQAALYASYVARDGQAAADTYSARPGFSEHQTGLAVDFQDPAGCTLELCFADTPSGKWLKVNAYRFGFVLRYPEGQTPVTGYMFEPWHFRYVGPALALAILRSDATTLEAYYSLEPAPDYR